MGIFDNIFKKAKEPEMIDRKEQKGSDTTEVIQKTSPNRESATVRKWRAALNSFESVYNPQPTPLYKIYDEVILDPHVCSVIDTRKSLTMSKPFIIKDEKNEVNEEWTEKFNRPDMIKVYGWVWDQLLWGHSLIQMGDIVDDTLADPELVNRRHVRAQTGLVTQTEYGNTGVPFRKPPYSNWTFEVGDDTYNAGLLNKVALCWIIKKDNLLSWATYSEKFGEPTKVLKTDINDQDKRENAADQLNASGSGSTLILGLEDELDYAQVNSGAGFKTFEDLANFCDSQISKLVLGGTMMTDDGSSRSQAEVHERVAEDKMKNDIWRLESEVNNNLIPKMRALGVPIPDGYTFEVENKEEVSSEARFDQLIELEKVGIKVDTEWITDKFNIPLEGRTEPRTTGGDPMGK